MNNYKYRGKTVDGKQKKKIGDYTMIELICNTLRYICKKILPSKIMYILDAFLRGVLEMNEDTNITINSVYTFGSFCMFLFLIVMALITILVYILLFIFLFEAI